MTTFVLGLLYVINLLTILVIVFRGRHRTAQTWAWVLVLTFLPIIGLPLYVLFGRGVSQRIFDLRDEEKVGIIEELQEQKEELQNKTFQAPVIPGMDVDPLIYMMTVDGGSLYTKDNHVDLFIDGIDKFEHLLRDIEQAQDHVHMEYFAYEDKRLGTVLRDYLIAAAQRGVKVKLLVDGWGSIGTKDEFFKPLKEAGATVGRFFPYITQVNYRNHRKIAIIDGKIGYVGGFNIGDEYLGLNPKMGYWRDNHLRIVGPAVHSLQNRFLMDWNSQFKNNKETYQVEYFPHMEKQGNIDIQVIASGPDSDHEQIKMVYLKMINMAKEEIIIQTPYYIPDDAIHEALKLALNSGVKLRMQIPNKPDHMLVYWGTYSFVAELMQLGATIEIYDNGFMHAKTIVVDGKITSIGSANFDIRSLHLNFEINAVMYSEEFAQYVRNTIMMTSQQCHVLTKELYDERSTFIRFKEGLARLIAPIL